MYTLILWMFAVRFMRSETRAERVRVFVMFFADCARTRKPRKSACRWLNTRIYVRERMATMCINVITRERLMFAYKQRNYTFICKTHL